MSKQTRIESFVEWFLSDYFPESGFRFGSSSDDWMLDPERMERCDNAASDGADGSTHREIIEDWRKAFTHFLRYGGKRNAFSRGYDRFEAAVNAHFDAVEVWHTKNGSIDEEIR